MDARDFKALFTRMNYSLIDPPNVAGYPGGMSWVDGGLFNTRKQVWIVWYCRIVLTLISLIREDGSRNIKPMSLRN